MLVSWEQSAGISKSRFYAFQHMSVPRIRDTNESDGAVHIRVYSDLQSKNFPHWCVDSVAFNATIQQFTHSYLLEYCSYYIKAVESSTRNL